MNTGKHSIEWLYHEQLKIDKEWAIQTPKGFKWWADKNAQTIEVLDEVIGPDNDIGYLISVRTEFLSDLEITDQALTMVNTILMPFASMAGVVYDEKKRTLDLCSLVRVHQGISGWMNPLISLAAIIQIGEVAIMGSAMAEALGAKESISGHPENGMRSHPDELAQGIADFIAPLGKQPCKWSEKEFHNAVEAHMKQPPALLATAGELGFTVEFPFGETNSSLCQIMGSQPHPRYGNGLFLLQSFSIGRFSDPDGIRLALSLNAKELTSNPSGYGFGSYAYRDEKIHFTSFFPNAMYKPGLLPNLYFACAARAKEMSLHLTDCDWTEKSFSLRRNAWAHL